MKIVTEQYIRDLLKDKSIKEFHVERGSLLSPAARDYLNQVRVRVCFDPPGDKTPEDTGGAAGAGGERRGKFTNAETGEVYASKPECMTHLTGNKLVFKDHARIIFRGELDHLQSQIVLTQALLAGRYPEKLLLDLEETLSLTRGLMRADVLDEPAGEINLFGLDGAELRAQSHNPQKYFGVKAMTLPQYGMGEAYARLNLLRTQSRQAEIAAVAAYREGGTPSREGGMTAHADIVTALNRLSSGFYVMCCRLLSGFYGEGDAEGGTADDGNT